MPKRKRRSTVKPLKPIVTAVALIAAIALAFVASRIVRHTYTPTLAGSSSASAAPTAGDAPSVSP